MRPLVTTATGMTPNVSPVMLTTTTNTSTSIVVDLQGFSAVTLEVRKQVRALENALSEA